jgi:hypothetical protein
VEELRFYLLLNTSKSLFSSIPFFDHLSTCLKIRVVPVYLLFFWIHVSVPM